MPLKHLTETLLVFTLGIAIVVTGILLPTLPPLPQGIVPWLIMLFLTLAYPVALYPFLRRNRADYAFRFLHFAPATMAIFWLLLQMISLRVPSAGSVLRGYLFAWTLPGVAVSFLLLALFILHVIRRRETRLTLLAFLFLPFLLLSTVSERTMDGSGRLAAALWRGSWWDVTGAASSPGGSGSEGSSSVGTSSSLPVATSSSARPPIAMASSSSKPPRLPSAGLGLDLLAVTMFGLYAGTLHRRAARRRSIVI
ncbi:MAG: hypothetical protein WCV62_06800 [Candidatus Peribacteraceae bacterium]|jgi:hypothetical protein